MKTVNGKMAFGFASVNAGQRNVVVTPQVIAVSTEGGFRITAPVSRVLGIAAGENVMFLSNVDDIDRAIATRAQEVVDFCEANGLDVASPEAAIALHKEFDMWAIAKGVAEKDVKGNLKTCSQRLSVADKRKYVSQNFDEMLAAAMENGSAELKEALAADGISKEEQIELLVPAVVPAEVIKYKGSKTASPSNMSGVGVSLTFTDTAIWKQLKSDLGDDATKLNRIYSVDVEDVQTIQISDGFDVVEVKALILGEFVDKAPSRIGAEDAE